MRKEKLAYYFSVEGETEKRYLDWLQKKINESAAARYAVKLDVRIEKDPMARVKGMSILEKTEIVHVFDRESEDPAHERQFLSTLDRMKAAEKTGKNVRYALGYSNFTFELWMILHKIECEGSKSDRKQYLGSMNLAFHENFGNLDEYKSEAGFRRVLGQLSLEDVKDAVRRAERIMRRNEEKGFVRQKYKGYSFYRENPSLSIWESIQKILNDCGLMESKGKGVV